MCIHKAYFEFPAAVNGGNRVHKSVRTLPKRTLAYAGQTRDHFSPRVVSEMIGFG